jgi:signal transduction histidine kinase
MIMKHPSRYPASIMCIDGIVLLMALMGFVVTMNKATLPFTVSNGNRIQFSGYGDAPRAKAPGITTGDTIVAVAGFPLQSKAAVEHVLDGCAIGDTVAMAVAGSAGRRELRVALVRHYSAVYLFIQCASAGFIFFLGVLVLLKKPENRVALVFHNLALCTMLLLMLTRGAYTVIPLGFGYLLRWLFPSTAAFTGATLLHFSLMYPERKPIYGSMALRLIYGIASVVGCFACYTSIRSTLPVSIAWLGMHVTAAALARILLLLYAAGAIGMFLHSYRHAKEISQKKKIRWILLGSAASIFGFAAFWQVPQLVLGRELIPEAAMLLIVTIFPLAMAISIIRYHLFDIDTLIHRSSVYAIVFSLLLLVFIVMQQALIELFKHVMPDDVRTATILAGATVIILFQPIRVLVQKLLDRWFFQIRYNFREAVRAYIDALKNTVDVIQLAELLVEKTSAFIPVHRIGVFLARHDGSRLLLAAHRGLPADVADMPEMPSSLSDDAALPIAAQEKVESEVLTNTADAVLFQPLEIALSVPLADQSGPVHGFLVLGDKLSGFPFSVDDLDLLKTIAYQCGREMERIELQRHLMEKRAEAARLEEMNRMKSFFVATVSHDLKTPLTSIKMFAELLRTKRHQGTVNLDEYLAIIEGECERLTHLINNVLDFSKIEAGVKRYSMTTCDAHLIVRNALEIMRYPMSMRKFRVDVSLLDQECYVFADHDAVLEALINLLSNAVKYSPGIKHVAISTAVDGREIAISVSDEGAGIAAEDQPHIFDSFYRANDIVVQKAGGTGLGLALVRHVMDAHNGRVSFSSVLGRGSTFTLHFPLTS